MAIVRKREKETVASPGPLRMFRPLLPNVPVAGRTNAAVLNHFSRLCSKPVVGSPTSCARCAFAAQLQTSPDTPAENGKPPRMLTIEFAFQPPKIRLSGP